MIAWYSRERSSLSRSMSCARVTVESATSPSLEVKLHSLRCMKRSAVLSLFLSSGLLSAQTRIVAPDNHYTPAQDVELGQKAANEARQTLPILPDDEIAGYIQSVGRR